MCEQAPAPHSPSVLGHELQVISAHDDGSLHLVGDDHALEDAATDGHVTSEGAPANQQRQR